VPQRIVDVLEVVEIEEQDGDAGVASLDERQGMLDAIAEEVAIGQQRQRIVERELPELLLQGLALADVAEVESETLHGGVLSEIAAHALENIAMGVALDAQLDGSDRSGLHFGQLGEERLQLLGVLTLPQLVQILAGHHLGPESESPLARG